MDHLAQQINILVRIFFKCPITDFNCVFDTIAKTKMASENKLHRPEIKDGRRKILLAMILCSSCFFYPSGNRRTIVSGDVKFFDRL